MKLILTDFSQWSSQGIPGHCFIGLVVMVRLSQWPPMPLNGRVLPLRLGLGPLFPEQCRTLQMERFVMSPGAPTPHPLERQHPGRPALCSAELYEIINHPGRLHFLGRGIG